MRRSLAWKMVLAFALVAFTSAGLVTVFINLTGVDRLTRLNEAANV